MKISTKTIGFHHFVLEPLKTHIKNQHIRKCTLLEYTILRLIN